MNYIVLPEDYTELSCASAVIRHEYSHISHHHSIELLLFDIMSAFQWFNPAVWLLRHDLCCVQEFQADASVLESGLDKLEYEKSLLSIATGGLSIPLVNGLGESYLRTRIRMMNRNISSKGNLLKLIYIPLVMVVALVLISNTVYDKAETDNTDFEADAYPEHDFIDLGLSVNWATCNLGSNYPYYRGTLYELSMEYQGDTATALWGKDWRMPTKEEFQELMDSCSWEFDNNNQGFIVTGRNGNSIFLPAGGFKSGDRDYLNYGSGVYLWGSRDLESSEEPRAWALSVLSGPHAGKRLDSVLLSLLVSHSIRPVTEQPYIPIQGIGLNRNRIELEIGREYKLNASFIPSDATRKRIFWYSGNSAVAKVDAHGKVTAVSDGECTIKAVCGDFKAECQVTVRMPKGYALPKQEEAVTIFRFGHEVNKEYIDSFQDDYDDSALETEEVFKTRIGDASGGITVTLFNYTDKDWNSDPGDFRIMDIDVAGRHYRFRNSDWVWEEMFDNGYFHCVKVAESRYLLFLKGFDYGCCPGTLTVFAIDETGVYTVMNKEYHLREFNREPFSMTVADWYDEYVSDDVKTNSTTYTLFIEDGALKKRWVQLYPNKHEYVDLGLSVNWATCNIGADKPEEYGDYFAWGETAPYYVKNAGADNELQWRKGKEAGYDWESYFDIKTIEPTDYDDIVTFWHYNTQEKSVIEYYHDAATINWGGEWRMPRQAEFEELINPDNCTWTWTTMNGVNGYRVTSKKPGYEGNSIFLPAAGGYSGTDSKLRDAYGWYWSGSIDDKTSDKSTNFAYILNFYFDTRFVFINSSGRCSGLPVRPVLPNGRNHKTVYGKNNEPIADNTEIETETVQTMSARFDGSLPESQVALLPYRENNVMPQSLPDIILDSLKIQYPELNTLESIFDDDGIKTNNKAYKGYLNFIRVSNSVYEFWIAGIEEKGGKTVTIEMGSIDDAITILENLITSYKQGNTIEIGGYSFTGVKGKAYSIPRNDGSDSGPYLVSVKNLQHDLSVLEKRKNWKEVGFDEIAFFSMENKPDHYEVLFPGWPRLFESLHINTWDGVDGGEEWARTELEKQIRERGGEGHVPGNSELAVSKFNGVILLPLHKSDYMTLSGAYKEYIQYYIPIIYDPEKYQAPLTDYQRSLKRRVFKRDSKKAK
ncbi:MAG: Ig-like domain-containing protein [Erysipelotrichaceae bacterium]|nr:Ig-like domain-containing protein [Erysipelotrichaceae bacterium]